MEFRIVPSGPTAAHVREAKFIEGALFDDMSISWADLLSDILTFPIWGWSGFEIVYKMRLGRNPDPTKRSRYNDGRIGWRKLAIRRQEQIERWELDEDGGFEAAWFTSMRGSVRIPMEKFLLFRTESNGQNPEGRSLLRNSFTSYTRKKRLEDIESVGAERDLAGLPDMQVPWHLWQSDDPDDQRVLAEMKLLVQQIRRDEREGIVRPAETDEDGKSTGWKFGLVTSGGSRQLNLREAIKDYGRLMMTSVLFQFLHHGSEKGSHALTKSHQTLAGYALGAFLGSIVDVFNRFAIPRLETLNRVPQDLWPIMEHGEIEEPDLAEFATYITSLVNSGVVMPTPDLEDKAREYGGLPPVEDHGIELNDSEEVSKGQLDLPIDDFEDSFLSKDQMDSLLALAQQVKDGTLKKAQAIALALASFPITKKQASQILG